MSKSQLRRVRSTIDCALDPETSLYAALPALTLLCGRTLLDTLHERTGEEGSRNTG